MAIAGMAGLIAGCTMADWRSHSAAMPYEPATFAWSGYRWHAKNYALPIDPGPNYFDASARNIAIDDRGQLHLCIRVSDTGSWSCSEIMGAAAHGYGTYRFTIASSVAALDSNVVLGLFVHSTDPAQHHREIDIEFARWGAADGLDNAQFVVQPHTNPGNLRRFAHRSHGPSTFEFVWRPDSIAFRGPGAISDIRWVYSGRDIPDPGDARVHLNLWLFRGAPPLDRREVEIVVSAFEFLA